MGGLTFDYSKTFIESHEMAYYKESVKLFHEQLHHKTGIGNDFLGWVEQPVNFDKAEFSRILDAAKSIKEKAQVLLVIGIGGSYIGARAAIEMLGHSFHNQLSDDERKAPAVYFVGNSLSGTYYRHLMDIVQDKEVCVCVISKSGTTIEPAIAFRMIKTFMEDRYGKQEAAKRIYAVTDAARGALKSLAVAEGYESFVIADDIGGRYSVLSPVGLLPIAAAGIDVELVMQGARDAYEEYMEPELDRNPCYQYAAARNILNRKGKAIEVMVSYEPALQYFSEWWKQLFGESEGKDGKGIFPASVSFSTDLHSLGQFLQDGTRNLFETILNVSEPKEDFVIPEDKENLDGLNFISGRYMSDVNKQAYLGTMLAHQDGGVPISVIDIPKADAYNFGKLVYFFEKACAMSGYLSGVNPFDQPGVEAYKRNMFALLGKPGYEELGEELNKKLK